MYNKCVQLVKMVYLKSLVTFSDLRGIKGKVQSTFHFPNKVCGFINSTIGENKMYIFILFPWAVLLALACYKCKAIVL